jgi:hypothetical protein
VDSVIYVQRRVRMIAHLLYSMRCRFVKRRIAITNRSERLQMPARWTEWKSFPDMYLGEIIQAPVSPGAYEVCDASSRRQIAFGPSRNVARTLARLLKPGVIGRLSPFRWLRMRHVRGELEYRFLPTGSVSDARVAVDQVLGRREALVRRFAQSAR